METRGRAHVHIATLLAVVAASPLLIWSSLAWLQGMHAANELAVLGSGDAFYVWWLAISLCCLLLCVAYLAGVAASPRGSSVLFYAVLLVTLVSAAGLFVHTVVLLPTVVLAYRSRVVLPLSPLP